VCVWVSPLKGRMKWQRHISASGYSESHPCIIIFEHQRAQKARQMRNENNNQTPSKLPTTTVYSQIALVFIYISIVTLAPDAKNAHYAIITLSSLAV
jgi:hypothetical protein